MTASNVTSESMELAVDHNLSLRELAEMGDYVDYNENVIHPTFTNPAPTGMKVGSRTFYLLTMEDVFGDARRATVKEMVRAMHEKDPTMLAAGGYHTIRALLTLGKEYPDKQIEGPIIDYSQWWELGDNSVIPFLTADENDGDEWCFGDPQDLPNQIRRLCLVFNIEMQWPENTRILAIKKGEPHR